MCIRDRNYDIRLMDAYAFHVNHGFDSNKQTPNSIFGELPVYFVYKIKLTLYQLNSSNSQTSHFSETYTMFKRWYKL